MEITVKITKLKHAINLPLPNYATDQSAGMDLLAAIKESKILRSGERILIETGLAISLPTGYEAQIRPRSGLAAKYGVTVLNSPGTIDADYRGEIKVILINHGAEDFIIEPEMRIAQMVVTKYEHIKLKEVDNLDNTIRGTGGFGSTGH